MKIVKESLSDVLKPKSKYELSMQLRPGAHFEPTLKSLRGTGGAGWIDVSYDELENLFGKPEIDEYGDKVRIQWVIEDEEGNVYSIYDWKSLKKPDYYTVKEIIELDSFKWHMGAGRGDADQLKIWIAVNT